jgi:ribosomal protein S18 acetylase RimI-like enzyme
VNVNLIPVKPENLRELQQLAIKIWNQHYPEIIGREQIDYMLNKNYTPEALSKQMEEGQQFFFITCDDPICGFFSMSKKDDGSYFIHKFYIDKTSHRQGIGSMAFAKAMEKFPDAKVIRLQVNRLNYKPINFYFKLGFRIEYTADFDIGDGYFMNDFVMVRY